MAGFRGKVDGNQQQLVFQVFLFFGGGGNKSFFAPAFPTTDDVMTPTQTTAIPPRPGHLRCTSGYA